MLKKLKLRGIYQIICYVIRKRRTVGLLIPLVLLVRLAKNEMVSP